MEKYVKKELSVVEIYAEREKTIRECKMTIANACEELLENPEANVYIMYLFVIHIVAVSYKDEEGI